jgi:universal stress protein E
MSWNRILWAIASPGEIETRPNTAAKALQLASALGAELEIFHCIFEAGLARPGRFASQGVQLDVREIVEQCHQQLEHNAERLRGHGVKVRTSVRWDCPSFEGIVRQVLRHKADLLIAESTRKGGAARLALTQTDFKLIETCPCPLLLIKTARPYHAARVVAAVDPTHAHDKPAALDGAIVEAAQMVTAALSGELLLLHARTWEDIARRAMALQCTGKALQPEASQAYCESIASPMHDLAGRHGIRSDHVHVLDGAAEETVPAFAHSEHADIVAMGAVSRSLLRRIFIGHTAERLLDALDCDVLIAKLPGFRSPVSARSMHRIDRSVAREGRYVF